MACNVPLQFYVRDPVKFGGVRGLTSDPRKALSASGLCVPCGRCVDCRLSYARDWSVRCMHEFQLSPGGGCFVTLTYDDAHLPEDNGLRYSDFQLFMHRLRNRFEHVRFFMCGEYGDEYGRPHYHGILFNFVPDDLVYLRREGKLVLYKSDMLAELWGLGFVSVGAVTRHSASYVARYSLKKLTGSMAADVYGGRPAPFARMSLKPGIGFEWFMRFHGDVFPVDNVIIEGKAFPVPRYYRKLYERMDKEGFDALHREHMAHVRALKASGELSERRLMTRWKVSVLNSANAKRNKGL